MSEISDLRWVVTVVKGKRFFRNNGLSIVLLSVFFALWLGQAVSGFLVYNADQSMHRDEQLGFADYLTSAHFLEATFENWESEFLQMAAYVVLTAFLYQKGSAESKNPDKKDPVDVVSTESPSMDRAPAAIRRGGWRLRIYEHSLSMALCSLFLISWIGHAVSGAHQFNDQLREHGRAETSLGEWVSSPQFWFESLQNWQSEFLAVGAIVILSIWLRELGSPESKPVTAPHGQTGSTGP